MLEFGEPIREGFTPYLSLNAELAGEFDYSVNLTTQVGARLFYQNGKSYRLAESNYSGFHQFGQYYNQNHDYLSLGFYLDY